MDTLPRGNYIGWHPWIIRGSSEYPGNPWILCQGCIIYRLTSTDNPGMSGVSGGIRGYSAKGILHRLASMDNPGMFRVSRNSKDTLPKGYCIGWHPRMSRVSGESLEGHWTTDSVLGQP